jgi:UDP-3-O-[3-hydroxymyristoyl] glucosamine N-acyltransferase
LPSFAQPATLGELAELVGGEVVGDNDLKIAGISSLEEARPGDLSFLAAMGHKQEFVDTEASAVIVDRSRSEARSGSGNLVLVDDSYEAVQRLLEALFPGSPQKWGIASRVTIGKSAHWSGRISIGEGSNIGARTTMGSSCVIGRNVVIGQDVRLGDSCRLEDGVVLCNGVSLGDRVSVLTGARIGTAGFGFIPSVEGVLRVTHAGGCVIGDDVEVGANTTIDRGSVQSTSIGARTKIDNLVQVGHNVRVGEDCIIVAQVGLAGSTTLEERVTVAGQAGLAGHLTVGANARIAAQSGVIGDVPPGATVSGYPAQNHRAALRQEAALRRITGILSELEALLPGDGSQ